MKRHFLTYVAGVVLLGAPLSAPGAGAEEAPAKAPSALTELEQKFQASLKNVTFAGRWCLVKEGKLTEERDEKYTISSAVKLSDDTWAIYARVQYGQKDVTIPVPVQVKWAGSTPVITLEKVALPGLGTYSARVLVHEGTYAGTWSGPGVAGMLHGLIQPN